MQYTKFAQEILKYVVWLTFYIILARKNFQINSMH